MRLALIFLAILAILLLFISAFRGTIFAASLKDRQFGGLLIAREVFALVLLGVALLETVGANGFLFFYVTDDSIHTTSPAILISTATLILAISLFARTLFRGELVLKNFPTNSHAGESNRRGVALLNSAAINLGLMLAVAHLLGLRHAFIQSLVSGGSLLEIRLQNGQEAANLAYVNGLIRFLVPLTAILLGVYSSKMGRIRHSVILALVIYSATFFGDKAPVVIAVTLYLLARLQRQKQSPTLLVLGGATLVLTGIAVIYAATAIQFPNLNTNELLLYLGTRLGVGQIQGVYEEFALRLRDPSYILTEVPFSGLLGAPHLFSKDLMMMTGGYFMQAADIGVMNSFFIGEAYAIGGILFVYIAPVIVGFNYCLLAFVTLKVLRRVFALSRQDSVWVVSLLIPALAPFTGDFGGLLMLKKLLAVNGFLLLLFPTFFIFRFLRPTKHSPPGLSQIQRGTFNTF